VSILWCRTFFSGDLRPAADSTVIENREGANMAVEAVKNIKIDPRVAAYKTFFDHAWSRKLDELAAGSKLAEPVFSLCMNWKSAANTHLMPWLMIENLKSFWEGFLRGQESYSERAVAHLAQHVPAAMGDSLSNMKRKKLAEVMTEIGRRMKQVREQDGEEIDPQALFETFLNGPGGSELHLSIWGSQRIVFGAVYHAYENFVSRCVGLARNEPDYRSSNIKALHADARAAFGDTTADYCLTDPPVDTARLVRNALAHHGGKETDQLKKVPHGVDVVDGVLQVMPDDNRRLFDTLKDRVFKLVETALTLPQCK